MLMEKYEAKLAELKISDCPIAYRQVVKNPGSNTGKCNIDFAKDAFDEVKSLGDCVAIALDIKGYFDNLDHGLIKQLWLELLELQRKRTGAARLLPDMVFSFSNARCNLRRRTATWPG